MLKRIYIDNFRGLVNFDLLLDEINLFLGPNGSGKSTVFDALQKIQMLLRGDEKLTALFPRTERTRWQNSPLQSFELEVEGNGGKYKYELAVEHDLAKPGRARIQYERLWFDDNPLLKCEIRNGEGETQLYRDDHSKGPSYPFNWSQSTLAALPERQDNTRLIWFRRRINRFVIVQPVPALMKSESAAQGKYLSRKMENFVSWYRFVSQDQGKTIEISEVLREVLEGFRNFKFIEVGEEHRLLALHFKEDRKGYDYRFTELSDGQRMLVALYTLLYAARAEDYTLCIDEPENYLALPEIQPWLTTLYDFCSEGEMQALLISHHPELIDYLASSAGYWFDYQNNAPVRVKRIGEQQDDALPVSELVARGWIDG
jgi:predicted ATPase